MADKTIDNLTPATTVNYTDNMVIQQGTPEAKKIDIPLLFTDENSSYAIQSGIYCFDHDLKISGNLQVTGSMHIGDNCEEDELIIKAKTTFECGPNLAEIGEDCSSPPLVLNPTVIFKCATQFLSGITGSGIFNFHGPVNVGEDLNVGDDANSAGLVVKGPATLGADCNDPVTLKGTTTIECDTEIQGNLEVTNDTDTASFKAHGNVFLGSDCTDTIHISGTTSINCDTEISGDLRVHDNVFIGDDLIISGNQTTLNDAVITGNTVIGTGCGPGPDGLKTFEVNSLTFFNCNASGVDWTGNFAYFNSGHFPSGIEVDAPEHADCGCGSREMAAIWPSDHHAYNIGAASQAFKTIFAQSHYNTSDANKKTNIATSDLGLDFINQLRPVSFKYKPYMSVRGLTVTPDRTRYGLIAQDVKDALDQLGKTTYEFAGYSDSIYADENSPSIKSLDYSQFVGPIIKSIQELSAIVSGLQDQINNG